jgi:broad specificity phosphatase PhoE
VQVLLLARHGQSLLNARGLVNGDPRFDEGLSEQGMEEARRLGAQIAAIRIDAWFVSEFPRAQQTGRIALGDRYPDTPRIVDGDLGDVRIGELEGRTLQDYRDWKHGRRRDEPFPGGESLEDAARRYAAAYERLLGRTEETILCICHEIPVRYAVNAAAGSGDLDGPIHDIANAAPYVFDADGLRRAVPRIRELAG